MNRVLYGHPLSGNVHRARLLLSMLGLPFHERAVDIPAGEQRTQKYLNVNPLGQVPVLVEDDTTIRDSHSILFYLAAKYGAPEWMPQDPLDLARVMQWISYSANEIHHGASLARLHFLLGVPIDVKATQAKAEQTLSYVDGQLSGRQWLALDRPSLADLAVFPYLALVEDAKVPLAPHRNVSGWIERVKALPGYVSMPGMS